MPARQASAVRKLTGQWATSHPPSSQKRWQFLFHNGDSKKTHPINIINSMASAFGTPWTWPVVSCCPMEVTWPQPLRGHGGHPVTLMVLPANSRPCKVRHALSARTCGPEASRRRPQATCLAQHHVQLQLHVQPSCSVLQLHENHPSLQFSSENGISFETLVPTIVTMCAN